MSNERFIPSMSLRRFVFNLKPKKDAPMTLDEYKKKVEASLRKRYPNITEEEIKSYLTMTDEVWEEYMQDFSPEELPGAWEAGA